MCSSVSRIGDGISCGEAGESSQLRWENALRDWTLPRGAIRSTLRLGAALGHLREGGVVGALGAEGMSRSDGASVAHRSWVGRRRKGISLVVVAALLLALLAAALVGGLLAAPDANAAPRSVLIVAPHPDDEVLYGAGVTARALAAGAQVTIVYMTNGDYYDGVPGGLARADRAVDVQTTYIGTTEDDLIFLGYPDGGLATILSEYSTPGSAYMTDFGVTQTYGDAGPRRKRLPPLQVRRARRLQRPRRAAGPRVDPQRLQARRHLHDGALRRAPRPQHDLRVREAGDPSAEDRRPELRAHPAHDHSALAR